MCCAASGRRAAKRSCLGACYFARNILALDDPAKPVLFYRVTQSGRGELDASRFTPWSSPVRLCGSSATLKANADGRGTGTRGPITTKPKVTPYASEPFAESPPALLVRAGTASPTAADTLGAHSPHLSPPRGAARPWR